MVLRIRRDTGIILIVVTHDIDEAVYLADRVELLKMIRTELSTTEGVA